MQTEIKITRAVKARITALVFARIHFDSDYSFFPSVTFPSVNLNSKYFFECKIALIKRFLIGNSDLVV